MADETTDDIEAERQRRYEESRRAAEVIQAKRRIDAAGYQPPGSPSQFLGRESQLLGPRTTDEYGIPLPMPRGAVGLRGYPSQDELTGEGAAARDSYNANVAAQFPHGISGPLGNAANVNFASRDDLTNLDVNNAIGRYPSAPRFQMPSTDQLIDAGIQAKRDALQPEINKRKVHLGLLDPSAIGAVATTLDSDQPRVTGVGRHGQARYGASQADQTRAELALLERHASGLDRAQADVIRQNSHLALQNAKDNEVFSQDVARGQVVHFLNNIDETRYPHGSPDRQAFIGKVFGNRPDWLHVMAKDKDLTKYVQEHVDAQDAVGKTMAVLNQLYPDEESLPTIGGVRMVPSVNAKGAVSYRGSTAATPDAKAQAKLEARLSSQTGGLTPEEFAAIPEDNVKAGGIITTDANGKKIFHIEGGGFSTNGMPKGEFSNDFTNFIEKYEPGKTQITPEDQKKAEARIAASHAIQIDTGKGYKSVIPRVDYERYRQAFAPDDESAVPQKSQGKVRVIPVDEWLKK
jgi:hypothetical protein